MEKISKILFLFLSLFLLSCDSEFDEDRLTSGTWQLKTITESSVFFNDYDDEMETTEYFPAKPGDLTYRFNSDGTFQVRALKPSHFDGAVYDTWKTGKWTSERNWLYLDMEGVVWEYHIDYLRKKSLSLEYVDREFRVKEIFERKDW